jgi:hypothetical protein
MGERPTTEAGAEGGRDRSGEYALKGCGCLLLWVVFVVVGGFALALMEAPDDFVFYRERRDEDLFHAAKAASAALVEFHREQGRMPSSLSEAPELEAAVARMVSECETLGAAAPEAALVAVAEETEDAPPPAVIVRDKKGETLVAISADGEVAISSTVMTRRARRVPEWIEILRTGP